MTFAAFAAALGTAGGCHDGNFTADPNSPELAAYLRLTMPKKIELQRYLTKPVSLANDGNPDGLEILLLAQDAAGDVMKAVGTFHFELYKRRGANEDRFGERIAFWAVKIDSEEALKRYWDRQVRLYRFPVKIEGEILQPGHYILTAQLAPPTGDRLFDEYEFTHEGGQAPPVTPKY